MSDVESILIKAGVVAAMAGLGFWYYSCRQKGKGFIECVVGDTAGGLGKGLVDAGTEVGKETFDKVLKPAGKAAWKEVLKPAGKETYQKVLKPTYTKVLKPVGKDLEKRGKGFVDTTKGELDIIKHPLSSKHWKSGTKKIGKGFKKIFHF